MNAFAEKNERRKRGRSNGTPREQTEARRLRRSRLGVRGAFGEARREDWNDMVFGTTGSCR